MTSVELPSLSPDPDRDIWLLTRSEIDQTARTTDQTARTTGEMIAWARELLLEGGQVHVLETGPSLVEDQLQSLIHAGADVVHHIVRDDHGSDRNAACGTHDAGGGSGDARSHCFDARETAAHVLTVIEEYEPGILLAAADTFGRATMPYIAARLATGLTADCTELTRDPKTGDLLQTRPAIGGHIMATIRCLARRPQMATVRPHTRRPLAPDPTRRGLILREICPDQVTSSFVAGRVYPNEAACPLEDADRIVVVGRGIGRPERLDEIRRFAGEIDAALGATREVVDRGWLDYSCQIGLSGRTVVPKLYIGLGVSGAIQHLAGMQTSGTIVAVNRDPEAPIFRVADFAIVGDLAEVLPALRDRFVRPAPSGNKSQDRVQNPARRKEIIF